MGDFSTGIDALTPPETGSPRAEMPATEKCCFERLERKDEMHNVSAERAVRATRQAEADLSAARQPVQLRGRVHEGRPGTYRLRSTVPLITGAAGDVA